MRQQLTHTPYVSLYMQIVDRAVNLLSGTGKTEEWAVNKVAEQKEKYRVYIATLNKYERVELETLIKSRRYTR